MAAAAEPTPGVANGADTAIARPRVASRPGSEILVAWGEIQFEALNKNIHVKHFLIRSIRCIFSRQHNGAKSVKEISNQKLAQNRRVLDERKKKFLLTVFKNSHLNV